MLWNLTFIGMTDISNTNSVLEPGSLGHVVHKMEMPMSNKDIIPSKLIGFYRTNKELIYFSVLNSVQNIKALAHILFGIFCTQSNV